MVYELLKRKLLDLYRWNVLPRIEALHAEQIYQGIFDQQCRQRGITEVFYPVGAAASYSLMYLLTRVLSELPVQRVLEMGSGQTTQLIDLLRPAEGNHVAYEQDAFWARTVAARAPRCTVLHRPLAAADHAGVIYNGYAGLEAFDFDLLLVDGPNGTDHVSRYDCIPLVAANSSTEFIVIIDDAGRPGEQETVAALVELLKSKSVDFKLNYLAGRTTQAVITTPAYRAASYFF
jgi:hypothetical protein